MVNLALLGAGRIGQVHARAIANSNHGKLAAVFDPVEQAARALVAQYSGRVANLDEILGDPGIDGVLICTPSDTHADLIRQVVSAGKAAFCEKPIATDVATTQTVLDHVADAQGTLMLGFQRRFDPSFIALKERLAEGSMGALESLLITSRDPAAPPYSYMLSSGGLFKDMTIHDFDVARWLIDQPIQSVYAVGGALTDPQVATQGQDIDTASIIMTTASGVQCTILNSRRATYGYDQRIEVLCAGGMLQAQSHHENSLVVSDAQGMSQAPLQNFFMTRYVQAYAAEIEHFVTCLAEKRAPRVTGQDGIEALKLAEAAYQSLHSGQVVRL